MTCYRTNDSFLHQINEIKTKGVLATKCSVGALNQMWTLNKPNVKDISAITEGNYTETGYWILLWSYLIYHYFVWCNNGTIVMFKGKKT